MNFEKEKIAITYITNYALCSIEEASKFVKQFISNANLFNAFLKREDVSEYLQKSTPQEILTYAKEFKYHSFLTAIIIKRNDVKEYLSTVYFKEALDYANQFNNSTIWNLVLSRSEISLSEIFSLLNKFSYESWEIAIARKDFKEYLDGMLLEELLDYAKKLNSSFFWSIVLKREDVKKYFEGMSIQEIINYQNQERDQQDIWELTFQRKDVKEYLDEMSAKELLDYAKNINSPDIWIIAFAREDIIEYLKSN